MPRTRARSAARPRGRRGHPTPALRAGVGPRAILVMASVLIGLFTGATPMAGVITEQWGVHELTFTALGAYTRPFQEVRLLAEFRHTASGSAHRVEGFYDGDGQGGAGPLWRVRFRPTAVGRWTWTTVATPADPGLHGVAGVLLATPPRAGNHGPLRPSPAPYLHLPHADGTYRFELGLWYYSPWELSAPYRARWLDFLQAHGVTRVTAQPLADRTFAPVGETKFDGDFGTYNLTLFSAIDIVMRELQARGMTLEVSLYHNDDEAAMTPAQDEAYIRYVLARYGAFRAFRAKLANQVDWHYGGFCSTEAEIQASLAWGQAVGQTFTSNNPFGVLVAPHDPGECTEPRGAIYYLPALDQWPFAAWSDWIMKQMQVTALSAAKTLDEVEPRSCVLNERGLARLNALVQTLRSRYQQAVSVDEYSFEYEETCTPSWWALTGTGTRKTHWVLTLAGAFGSTRLAGLPGEWGIGDFTEATLQAFLQRPTLPQLGILATLVGQLPFWEMVPSNDLVSPAEVTIDGVPYRANFALAKPGVVYLIYALNGGAGTVTLAPGTYAVWRLDPRTGTALQVGHVMGGTQPFVLPTWDGPRDHQTAPSDWVLVYLHTTP